MGIYIFVFAYLCFFSILEMMRKRICPNIVRKGLYIFAFLVLFYIAGFRYGLETDYWTYYNEFYGFSPRTLEFTFNILMLTIKTVTNSYTIFLIILAAIMMGLKYKVFSQYNFCFSILLIYYARFFVQFDLNAIRQGLAIAISFFAFEKLKKNELKKYIILIIFASTIHSPALILLVLPLLKRIKMSTWRILIGIAVATVFRFYIFGRMIPLFSKYLPYIFASDISIIRHLQYILNNDTTSNAIAIVSYLRIVLPTICLYFLTKKTKNETFYRSYYIGALINVSFLGLDTISFRLAAYFFAAEILIMGDLYNTVIPIRSSKAKINIKKFIPFIIVVFCDMWTFFSLLATSETLVPFQTIFTQ